MANIILQRCGFSTAIEKQTEKSLDVTIRALSEGNYTDMNGTDVEITADTINDIVSTYNEHIKNEHAREVEFKPGLILEEYEEGLNQVNHIEGDALLTVGRVVGFMRTEIHKGKTYLFFKVRVKGKDNVERVADNRWRDVSIQYNPVTHEFIEVSWVSKGADSTARAMMGKNVEEDKKYINLNNTLAIIAKKQELLSQMDGAITKLGQHYEAKKHLVALCRTGKLNRAKSDFIEKELVKFSNPKDVISLVDSCLPNIKFKPRIIADNDKRLFNLLKGNNMADKKRFNSLEELSAAAGSIKLADGERKEVRESYINENRDLSEHREEDDKEREMSKHHAIRKDFHKKMKEADEKGDHEMRKSHHEKLMKFEDDCAMGKVNLSEYEIEEESKGSDEIKELAKKMESYEHEFSKFREDVTVSLKGMTEATLKLASKESISKIEDEQKISLKAFEEATARILAELHRKEA